MKRPNALFKIAAVVSAVLLIGGFVSYKAGAFDRFLGSDAQPAEPANGPAPGTNQPVYMGGSKYKVLIEPAAPQQAVPGTTAPSTIMSGSKSLAPLIVPPAPAQPAAQPPSSPQASKPTP